MTEARKQIDRAERRERAARIDCACARSRRIHINLAVDVRRRIADIRDRSDKPSDNFALDTRVARSVSAEIERLRRAVGDMVPENVYDSWEAALVGLGGDEAKCANQ